MYGLQKSDFVPDSKSTAISFQEGNLYQINKFYINLNILQNNEIFQYSLNFKYKSLDIIKIKKYFVSKY